MLIPCQSLSPAASSFHPNLQSQKSTNLLLNLISHATFLPFSYGNVCFNGASTGLAL